MSNLSVGIVGAGVIGLSTALELQKEIRGCEIKIFADKFTTETTSNVAAGLFRPGTSFVGPNVDVTKKWIKDAFDYYYDLSFTSDASIAGVTQISGYIFASENKAIVKNPYIEDIVPIYRSATEDELQLCPGKWRYGSFFSTILTECRLYLPWAMDKFKSNGGQIIEKNISTFSDLNSFDVIVNCTGLGAKYLCNDLSLMPVRGQVIKVEAPWIKTFMYGDYDTYIIPGFDTVTLGGTRQLESYDLKVNKHDSLSIMERCKSLVPSLKDCTVKRTVVGLRPHRTPVRIEKEIINTATNKIKVVHNYGHGGYGVTTAPGCAKYAVNLLKEQLMGNSKL